MSNGQFVIRAIILLTLLVFTFIALIILRAYPCGDILFVGCK